MRDAAGQTQDQADNQAGNQKCALVHVHLLPLIKCRRWQCGTFTRFAAGTIVLVGGMSQNRREGPWRGRFRPPCGKTFSHPDTAYRRACATGVDLAASRGSVSCNRLPSRQRYWLRASRRSGRGAHPVIRCRR
jgi:hypothetical protein